jgi:uncharacterized membrane protein YgdD (TMEM256/DUF423 family)
MSSSKKSLLFGSIFLVFAVCIGAFGAHGLKDIVIGKYAETFKTGVTYHYYHALGLIILGLIKTNLPQINIDKSLWAFLIGILLFSFNCYFYAITHIKTFAMVVPLGGVLFIIGWTSLSYEIYRKTK